MEKINQVIDMIEHPELYSEAHVEKILQDEECRQIYLTMMEMRMAFDKEATEKNLNVEQEWNAFAEKHQVTRSRFAWTKVAASVVGVLLLSGIAVAAIHTYSSHQEESQVLSDSLKVKSAPKHEISSNRQLETKEMQKPKDIIHKTFDNVTLSLMLDEMAKHYGVTVEYRNAEAKQLRFYYEWNSEDGLSKVLDELNHSQQVSLSLVEDKILVE